jgi:CBS domain containing-hemolysin-like protein
LTLLLVVLVVAANGSFVAAEFAIVEVRRFRFEEAARRGMLRARLSLHILAHVGSCLAACQPGITMASLGLGWVGEPFVAAMLEPVFLAAGLGGDIVHLVSFLLGFLPFSSLHIVIGEQVPKTCAIRRPEPVSLWVAIPLHAFYLLLYPLARAPDRASLGTLGLPGVEEARRGEVDSPDELESLIAISNRYCSMRRQERDMLAAILELAEVEVGEAMTHRRNVVTIDAALPLERAVEIVVGSPYTRFPLWKGDPDQIVGVVHVKDVLHAGYQSGTTGERRSREDLASPPWFVPETTSLLHQLLAFRQRRAHLAIVVDEYGSLLGLVTLEDILEEIVGDIVDEKDGEAPGIRIEADGSVLDEGHVTVRDLNRHMDWDLPEEEAATVAGLVVSPSASRSRARPSRWTATRSRSSAGSATG